MRCLHCLCLGALLIFAVANVGYAGLAGVTVNGFLYAASDQTWDQASAVVGDRVEFTYLRADGLVEISLDVADDIVMFTVSNRNPGNEINPDGLAEIGVRGFRLTNLNDPAGPITSVILISSTFPGGTFDSLSFTPTSLAWTASTLVMPGKGTVWRAAWRLTTGTP